MKDDLCDLRIAFVLAGCRAQWAQDIRYVDSALPVDRVRELMRPIARAQAGENVQAAHYRAKTAFGLQK